MSEKEKPVKLARAHTMLLPYELTDAERLIRAKELSAVVDERTDASTRLDQLVEGYKGAKKALEADVETLDSSIRAAARVVRSGREDRPVEVVDVHDLRRGVTDTKRADTGEVVATRAMTDAERREAEAAAQRDLFEPAEQRKLEALAQAAADQAMGGEGA